MSEIAGIQTRSQDRLEKVTWANLRNGDTGAWVHIGGFADKTVGVIVNAAGSGDSVTIEGSQDGGTNFGDLHDPQGDVLTFVGATINDPLVISETPEAIRPNVTAGDSATDLTVIITMPIR